MVLLSACGAHIGLKFDDLHRWCRQPSVIGDVRASKAVGMSVDITVFSPRPGTAIFKRLIVSTRRWRFPSPARAAGLSEDFWHQTTAKPRPVLRVHTAFQHDCVGQNDEETAHRRASGQSYDHFRGQTAKLGFTLLRFDADGG